MQLDVKERVAVVTGSSSGIGFAVVKALLEAGALVAGWDLQESESIRKLHKRYTKRLLTLRVDVSDETAVKRAAEVSVARFSQVDIVVNCAGIMYKDAIEDIDMEAWNRINDINLKGTLLVNKHLVPYVKQSRCGRIINISSMTALIGLETYIPYTASKAAVSGMTRALAAELAPYGVTVNAICPGWVDTPMLDGLFERIASIHGYDKERAKREVLDHVPQRRFIHPDEIAFSVLFLASPLAQGISGTDFLIDNGLTNTFKPGLHMRHPGYPKA